MSSIKGEIAAFIRGRHQQAADARQMAALQILCGVDLAQALTAGPEERGRIVSKLARRLRRERLRGLARHWSYDLDRHIALKQALDRLLAAHAENDKGGHAAAFGSQAVG